MALPIVTFKATNTDLTPELEDLVTEKFQSLDKFIGEETDTKCEVEFERIGNSQNGNIYRVETNLWLHGHMYRAEAVTESFEKSIDEVKNEIEKELRRAHKKRHSLIRRGGRQIKEMLRFG